MIDVRHRECVGTTCHANATHLDGEKAAFAFRKSKERPLGLIQWPCGIHSAAHGARGFLFGTAQVHRTVTGEAPLFFLFFFAKRGTIVKAGISNKDIIYNI